MGLHSRRLAMCQSRTVCPASVLAARGPHRALHPVPVRPTRRLFLVQLPAALLPAALAFLSSVSAPLGEGNPPPWQAMSCSAHPGLSLEPMCRSAWWALSVCQTLLAARAPVPSQMIQTAPRHCRDLKPENFLLATKASDAELKATDFGLSVFYKPGQEFKDIVGSAYYVAPEVGGGLPH